MLKRVDLVAHWKAHGIDPGRCYYTGWPTGGVFEIDQRIPPSRGGTHDMDNLVPCLPAVQQLKVHLTAVEFLGLLDSGLPELGVAV